MKTLHYLSVVLAVFISMAACTLPNGGSNDISQKAELRKKGLQSLACFQCHAYDVFTNDFPHELHIDMLGIHCTQCHTMQAHKEISLNDNLCLNCHSGVPKLKSSRRKVT